MNRGVIAAPAIINIQGNGFTMERGLSLEEIRYYALYWDRVVIPGNNLVYIGLPDEDILIESGVIERPRVGFQGSFGGADLGHAFAVAQSLVAKKLIEEDKSIDWALHQIGNKLNIPQEYCEEKHSLRFELINLLPVPEGEVPIPDILEFKERRGDELEALHQAIEAAYVEALKNPDPDLGSAVSIRELRASIDNLNVVADERWEKTSKFDFSASFNLDGGKFIQSVAGGAAFDFFTNGFTMPVGTIAGGLASLFKLKASYGASFKPAANSSTLAFLSHASDEGIIGE
ncbi:DUF6236 family protein [Spongiibacter taiwanensis]|uniref:DUF6236 family protein n=1 Tax=Spongiibacter taiwanensis TaxID=1748242 RepID=UPI00203515B9|nr:DUF6236 family protein [Spongiibacter taiwanensis]USA41695.1 DUF6236 family protein [Spongiibacter taiwanensis]